MNQTRFSGLGNSLETRSAFKRRTLTLVVDGASPGSTPLGRAQNQFSLRGRAMVVGTPTPAVRAVSMLGAAKGQSGILRRRLVVETQRDGLASGVRLAAIASLIAGSSSVSSSQAGAQFTLGASFLPGSATAYAAVLGRLFSRAASVQSGSTSSGAFFGGTTLHVDGLLVPGLPSSDGIAHSGILVARSSLLAGRAVGDKTVASQVLTRAAALSPGAPAVITTVPGQLFELRPDVGFGNAGVIAAVTGQTFVRPAQLLAGVATGAVLVTFKLKGQGIQLNLKRLIAGYASGAVGALVDGQLLGVVSSINDLPTAGLPYITRLLPGGAFSAGATLLRGRPSADASVRGVVFLAGASIKRGVAAGDLIPIAPIVRRFNT